MTYPPVQFWPPHCPYLAIVGPVGVDDGLVEDDTLVGFVGVVMVVGGGGGGAALLMVDPYVASAQSPEPPLDEQELRRHLSRTRADTHARSTGPPM